MTLDLSFRSPRRVPPISEFYTDLHRSMLDNADVFFAPFPTTRDFRRFLQRFFPESNQQRQALDAGCGGMAINSISCLAQGFGRVTALDLNQQGLQAARSLQAGAVAERRLSLVTGSILDLPYLDDCFDLVVASGVIHHTSDPPRALAELGRVLKPGGRLYLAVYCFEGSLFCAGIRLLRALGRMIPFRLAHSLGHRSDMINNFVLDHMYVPVLWVYRVRDVHRLLAVGPWLLEGEEVSSLDPFAHKRWLGKSLVGDGLLRLFYCRKVPGGTG